MPNLAVTDLLLPAVLALSRVAAVMLTQELHLWRFK